MDRLLRTAAAAGVSALAAAPLGAETTLPDKLAGHGGPIKSVTVSLDGSHVLTASFDYALIYWDVSRADPELVHRLRGHGGAANDAAFVPGHNAAVSVGDDGTLILWDLGTGDPLGAVASDPVKMLDVDVAPGGRLAAAAAWDGTVRLYDLDALAETARLPHRANVNAVAFSADGRTLYSAANNGQITEWDIASRRAVRPIHSHGWGVNSIAMLPGNRLAFGGLDGSFGVIDLDSDSIQDIASSERPILTVRASADGALVGFGDGAGEVAVFTTASGALLERGAVTYGPVWDFDFIPGTQSIYHVGLDDFAALWRISPRDFEPIKAELPRRFQIRDSEDPGELEFLRKCSVCHTLTPDDGNRAGPTLYQLFGRKAGSLPDYPYSPALRELGVVWTEETVARLFDDGPDVMVPGTTMPIQRLKQVTRRDELIRFLKTATATVD
ncbi:MAG: cytochrome C [Pseudomonadota bacterium]